MVSIEQRGRYDNHLGSHRVAHGLHLQPEGLLRRRKAFPNVQRDLRIGSAACCGKEGCVIIIPDDIPQKIVRPCCHKKSCGMVDLELAATAKLEGSIVVPMVGYKRDNSDWYFGPY